MKYPSLAAGYARRGVLVSLLTLAACGGSSGGSSAPPPPAPAPPRPITGVTSTQIATFAAPWSMAFTPDGRLMVSERVYDNTTLPGKLWIVTQNGTMAAVGSLPTNYGILDVLVPSRFAFDAKFYFTFLEPADPGYPRIGRDAADSSRVSYGLALATATLTQDSSGAPQLANIQVIWRQTPKIVSYPGSGEPGGRIAFSPDGRYLFLTCGDRQELDSTFLFMLDNSLGKTIRLFPDGSIPPDNPFVGHPGALGEIWTLGHRNQYGLAFAPDGSLWENENGPAGGDELNLLEPGNNYGWPAVSSGNAYTGEPYPRPMPGDGYATAAIVWTPAIAPSSMIFYAGSLFAAWRGDAIITGLQSEGLIRVQINGASATEVQRVALGARMRSVIEASDGVLWALEDAPTGRLLKLAPVF